MLLAAVGRVASAQPAGRDSAVIARFLEKQAALLEGTENEGARATARGDLSDDGVADAVVLYTIEGAGGGTGYTQYLAAFVRLAGRLTYVTQTAVGGKWNRAVTLGAITGGVIHLETREYREDDPSCCPSRRGSMRLVLAGGQLRAP
jgi:hypothetical protein